MQSKVVITGIGIVSPLGIDSSSTWQQLKAGVSAARPLSFLKDKQWPVSFGHEVDAKFREKMPAPWQKLPRPTQFAALASREALLQADLRTPPQDSRMGCYVGAGIGAIAPQEILAQLSDYKLTPNFAGMLAFLEGNQTNNLLARHHPHSTTAFVANEWGIAGPRRTFTTACSASAQAIGYGFQDIRRGKIDVALVGGADSIVGEILMMGFCLLGVLSKRSKHPQQASRPFDQQRDGFVIGEGSAFLVLENADHARNRGVPVLATLEGYGESENAYRITDLPEDGAGALAAMQAAINDAHLNTDAIDCINTHGTSTEANDRVEAAAIQQLYQNQPAQQLPKITANKSAFGHLIAAAGAIEAAVSAMMLQDQWVPPIVNFSSTNCAPLPYAKQSAPANLRHVLSNSFGFGGTNASIVLGRSSCQ